MGGYENVKEISSRYKMIAEVLFPVALDKTFYYRVPKELEPHIKPGIRIYASFARRKKVLGYIISVFDKVEMDLDFELKKIDKIIDTTPPFVVEKFIELATFISQRWFSTRGMILRDFLRYLPLKLEVKESNLDDTSSVKKLIISDNILTELLVFLRENYSKKPIVVFFPNIFILQLFKKTIESDFKDVEVYTSDEKISYKKRINQIVLNNQFKLILSTKLGIHLPFRSGVDIVLVEPINSLYRQFEQHPYYDTVEVLLKIADIYKLDLLFLSSFTSPFFMELEKKGVVIVENKKKGDVASYRIYDIKKDSPLSSSVIDDVKNILESKKKVMFISYSKYSASITFCPSCRDIKRCSRCGSVMRTDMVDHKRLYVCSYCNYKEEYSNFCHKCKIPMVSKGYGSQRFYEELLDYFPDKKILLIDGRIIHSPHRFNQAIKAIMYKDFDIICATEIAATHILNLRFSRIIFIVYESQYLYDYSYAERFFEKFYNLLPLLDEGGGVDIYTYNPDSFLFSKLSFPSQYLSEEIELRRRFNYPPYGFLYEIKIFSKDKDFLKEKVNELIKITSDEEFKKENHLISFDPAFKIKKLRLENNYVHTSLVKLESYERFFRFMDLYASSNKLKLDVIAR